MEITEPGVIEDEDPEFLHDFRVACRRSRALIGRVRGVLPRGARRLARVEFAWLSRCTSDQRDLDVLLQALQLRAQAQDLHARALAPLQDALQHRRAAAHGHLVRVLRSRRYLRFKRNWRAFLDRAAAGAAGNRRSARSIAAVAGKALARSYRRVRKLGGRLNTDPRIAGLHELRKQSKKLRYLLEAFASLYPIDTARRALKDLEKFQDRLGAIADCSAHVALLRDCRRRLGARRATAAAINQLIAGERSRRGRLLVEFPTHYRRFDRKSHRRRFRELLRYSHGS
jgi:CHAD domain-containing protein